MPNSAHTLLRCARIGRWRQHQIFCHRRYRSNNILSLRNLCRTPNLSSVCCTEFSKLFAPFKRLSRASTVKGYNVKAEQKCWNCNKSLEVLKFSCLNCGVLQYPDPKMTYFELLDLPPNFDLDAEDISTKYKMLQMMFHPDRYARKSKEEMDISDHYSKLVNKAYSTLKSPLSRGMYILNLNGIDTDDESVKMNQEFLLEILEKNEELENVNDFGSLQEISRTNNKAITEFISMASKAFQANDLQTAREALMKMKYFVNMENTIKKKKSILGIID